MTTRTKRPKVTAKRLAGPDHAVVSIEGGRGDLYRREPCPTCPWRLDAVGIFPAEAFKHSVSVAYDVSIRTFACHESGTKAPATCAGFLLKNSANNLGVRMKDARGLIDFASISDGGVALFASYREMAVANGVAPDDPVLEPCRADDETRFFVCPKCRRPSFNRDDLRHGYCGACHDWTDKPREVLP